VHDETEARNYDEKENRCSPELHQSESKECRSSAQVYFSRQWFTRYDFRVIALQNRRERLATATHLPDCSRLSRRALPCTRWSRTARADPACESQAGERKRRKRSSPPPPAPGAPPGASEYDLCARVSFARRGPARWRGVLRALGIAPHTVAAVRQSVTAAPEAQQFGVGGWPAGSHLATAVITISSKTATVP
jgi:hypothetical protein